jgi:hypothetical protein
VTISCGGSAELTLFCKHGPNRLDAHTGHRRGTPYEAEVYAGLLIDAAPAPICHGSFGGDHGTTLVLEAVQDLPRLTESGVGLDSPVVRAAAELGCWHRRHDSWDADAPAWLNRYDGDHLGRWASALTHREGPAPLRGRATGATVRHAVELLASAPATLVHGELFPPNALASQERTVFIDWETAGVGAGELDVAFMTVGPWPVEVRRRCEAAYVAERWPTSVPGGFEPTLAAARLYALALVDREVQRGVDRGGSAAWIDAQILEACAALG